jgi:hypothetical protein
MPLAKFASLDVTGIVEEGVRAKVDFVRTFTITPLAWAIRKSAPAALTQLNKSRAGDYLPKATRDEIARGSFQTLISTLIGSGLAFAADGDKVIGDSGTAEFEKYDDGWKVSEHAK